MTPASSIEEGRVVDLPASITNQSLHRASGVPHAYGNASGDATRKWVVIIVWGDVKKSGGGAVPCAVVCPFADIQPAAAVDDSIHYRLKYGELEFMSKDTCCVMNEAAMVPVSECEKNGRATKSNVKREPARWTRIRGGFGRHWRDGKLAPVQSSYGKRFPASPPPFSL
jgi:hypothetical protein